MFVCEKGAIKAVGVILVVVTMSMLIVVHSRKLNHQIPSEREESVVVDPRPTRDNDVKFEFIIVC